MVLYDNLESADNTLTAHLLFPEETRQFVEVTTMVVASDEDDVVTTIFHRCAMSSRSSVCVQQEYTRALEAHGLHLQVVDVARDVGTDATGGSRRRR